MFKPTRMYALLLALALLAAPAILSANGGGEGAPSLEGIDENTSYTNEGGPGMYTADNDEEAPPVLPETPPVSSGPQVKNKPKIVIDSYRLDPNPVQAGERFDLQLSFYNTNGINSIRNMKVTLSTADTTQNSGTVFIPDDTSNTFYARYIAPEGEVTKRIRMYVVPDAAQRTYTLTATFEYEDADGNEFVTQENFGIPVVQRTELTTGQLNLPADVPMYQPTIVPVPFYNTGKTTLYNLTVKLESDLRTDNPQMYVGNFASGAQDQFELNLTPEVAGEQNGKIVFSYEDVAGEKYTQEVPFILHVSEGMPYEEEGMYPEDFDMDQGMATPFWMNPLLWIAGVILVVILLLLLRRRKKKKEEEALEIHE